MEHSLLRIGIFYDGNYFCYAQQHYYNESEGWLDIKTLHQLIKEIARSKEQGYTIYKTVYASWFQGLKHSQQSKDNHLKIERNRHIDLLNAGVDLKFIPMNKEKKEKGIDVYMSLEVIQSALNNTIDLAVLITGDGDFIPLVRALMKNSVRTLLLYFSYKTDHDKSQHANPKLVEICDYAINFDEVKHNKKYKHTENLFRKNQ